MKIVCVKNLISNMHLLDLTMEGVLDLVRQRCCQRGVNYVFLCFCCGAKFN
uniref:Uncharacterized protein n=1 Tax=Setaria italica TaxID=4555 RepID=K4A3P5_SETIT